jgi:hypothetical protein
VPTEEEARAARARTVEALIDRGITLREQGRDAEAVEVFREARGVEDSPRTRTQLGLALLASGEFVEAYELLEGALASGDPWVEARREAIAGSFASAAEHVGVVEIVGGEPGAQVSINGRPVGALPLSGAVRALVGRAVVEATLEGFHTFAGEVTVERERTARLRIALVPRPFELSATPSRGSDDGSDDWILPVAIVGGVLIVAGAITGIAIALQPGYEPSDVGGVVATLRWP